MRKASLFILLITGFLTVFYSCDNTKTPQEYLREEKKAIDRFVSRHNIVDLGDIAELSKYSEDKEFKENEYFKTDRGLYIHVNNRGNLERKAKNAALVSVRFDYRYDIKDYVGGDTIPYTVDPALLPLTFKYGLTSTYDYYFACNGWAIPLAYVGENADIDLIIPSALGSTSNSESYRAVFFKHLRYTRFSSYK
jgi:hypothetical protein